MYISTPVAIGLTALSTPIGETPAGWL